MSVAAGLLLYSVLVLIVGPALLTRLTRAGHNPRLGIGSWLAAIASVLLSWAAAVVLAFVDLLHHFSHPGAVLASCLAILRGQVSGNAGVAIQVGLLGLATLGGAALAISAARFARILGRMRRRTHWHAHAVRLVGRRIPGLDAVVLEGAEPAAYCVPGRPDTVVFTSAALETLTEPQRAAILAHERAHLDGHHPQIMAVTRGLAATFPSCALMTRGAQHIARLLEMCADDRAARQHGKEPILGGLLALTGAVPAPSGALGATGVAVLARAERLAHAGRPGLRRTAVAAVGIALAGGGPVVTALLTASGGCAWT